MPQRAPAPSGGNGRVRATPLARAVARELGVDLAAVSGSGRGGRIVRADVEATAAAPSQPPPQAPQVHLTIKVDATALLELRTQLNHQRHHQLSLDDLIAKACAGLLAANQSSGERLTVSNLDGFGVERFTAVIDPPQAAVLAVGAVLEEPVAVATGGVELHQVLRLTLSIDHRALDGGTGARFLQQLKAVLEQPLQILA